MDLLLAYRDDPAWTTQSLEPDLATRKALDRDAFSGEVARFVDGVEWMERDPRLLPAFRLTNTTMRRLAERAGTSQPGWRLFQLVFLVSQLSALAWREHPAQQERPESVEQRAGGVLGLRVPALVVGAAVPAAVVQEVSAAARATSSVRGPQNAV